MTLAITNTFTSGTAAVASQVNTNFSDVVAYVNGTGGNAGVLLRSGGTLTGALTVGANGAPQASTLFGAVTVGQASAGYDVTFYGASSTSMVWNNTNKDLTITGTTNEDALIVAEGRTRLDDRVYCEGSDDITLSGISGALIVGGDGSGTHIAFDGNEIMAKASPTTVGTLHINIDGGTVKFGDTTDLTAFEVNGPATFNDGITGDVTGNVSGTAATVTTAAQSNITSVGTLTGLVIADGSASAPSIRFSGDADTGIYMYDVVDSVVEGIGFATSGTVRGTWQDAGLTLSTCSEGTGSNLELNGYGVVVKDSSSASVKNITDVNVLDHLNASMVDNLQLKMWSYKNDTSNHPQISLIAEEANAVSPFLNTNKFDEDGNVVPSGLSNKGLISLLIIALKDVRTRIAALEG